MSQTQTQTTDTTAAEVVVIAEVKPSDAVREYLSSVRTAAKAKRDAKGQTLALLAKGADLLGSAADAAKDVAKGEDLISQGRALLDRSEARLTHWTTVAHLARQAGVSARDFGKATGTNANMLARLAGARDLFDAAKANRTPITIGEAMKRSNVLNREQVAEQVAAYVAAEEGTDPVNGTKAVAKAPKPKTVGAYTSQVQAAAQYLADLLSGGFPTPKAEDVAGVEQAIAALDRMVTQTRTLSAQVAKAAPKAEAPKAERKPAPKPSRAPRKVA